ncbi:unnamed protein product, partial [Mesorhabditis spiculigera]
MPWLLVFALQLQSTVAFFDQKIFHLTNDTPSYALHGTGLAWKQTTSVLCHDDLPFLLAGKVPDVSGCTQAWSTCTDFQQFHFQCSWEVLGFELELAYREEVKTAGNYFAISIRVLEWIEERSRYMLFSVWPADDEACVDHTYEILMEPRALLTSVSRFDPLAGVVSFINRAKEEIVKITPLLLDIELDNQITCTKLTIDALVGGALEVGFTEDNMEPSTRKNYTSESVGASFPLSENIKQLSFMASSNNTLGGFRITLHTNFIERNGLTTPNINPHNPNFLLNLIEIFDPAVDMTFELVDLLDAVLTVTFDAQNNTFARNYTSAEVTHDLFNLTSISRISMTYDGISKYNSTIRCGYFIKLWFQEDFQATPATTTMHTTNAPRYLLFSVWPDSDKSCVHINYAIALEPQSVLTCVSRFEPETYTTMIPYNFFRMLSDDDDGALLEIYAGGYPAKDRTNLIGSTSTSQADQQLDSFAATVTFINRDEDHSISVGPEISKVAIDNIIITPNSNAPTFLSSFKYPWVFEEDPELFKPTIITVNYNQITCTLLTINALEGGTLEVGFTDNNVQISARKNTNDGGFRVVIYGNDIARGGLTTPKISPDEPNFLLNVVDIFGDEGNVNQFTAVVDGLVSETNITYTREKTPKYHKKILVEMKLIVITIACQIDILATIQEPLYIPQLTPVEPALLVNLEDVVPFGTLIAGVAGLNRDTWIVYTLCTLAANYECDLQAAEFGPCSSSDPEIFYPQYLFSGTFTLAVPEKCTPTISLRRQDLTAYDIMERSDCTGMRLVVSPGYKQPPIFLVNSSLHTVTWKCTAIDLRFELVDMQNVELTLFAINLNGTTMQHNYTSTGFSSSELYLTQITNIANPAIRCYDEIPISIDREVPDELGCTMVWPSCTTFMYIETQCYWEVQTGEVEIGFRNIDSPPEAFAVSIRVLEWVDVNHKYFLMAYSEPSERLCGAATWLMPGSILTFVPPMVISNYMNTVTISSFQFHEFTNDTTFVEAYYGGDPGYSETNFAGRIDASVKISTFLTFSAVTTLVNRNARGTIAFRSDATSWRLDKVHLTLARYTPTHLSSYKYPWIFEEDQDLFPVATIGVGFSGDVCKILTIDVIESGELVIESRNEQFDNVTNRHLSLLCPVVQFLDTPALGFRISTETALAMTGDAIVSITTAESSYMFNLADIIDPMQRFVARFEELTQEHRATLTICSLDYSSQPSQEAVNFVNCTSRADLTTRFLNCCTKHVHVTNRTSISLDFYNFTYFTNGAVVTFAVQLFDDVEDLTIHLPYNVYEDDELAFRVPETNKTFFVGINLPGFVISPKTDGPLRQDIHSAILKSILWPHSVIDCEYNLYPGFITTRNVSKPFITFRNSDIFYPQWLFSGTFTLEIPAGCTPTVSLGREDMVSTEQLDSTECSGMRFVVTPAYSSAPLRNHLGTLQKVTWICDPVDVELELVDLVNANMDIFLTHADGTIEHMMLHAKCRLVVYSIWTHHTFTIINR